MFFRRAGSFCFVLALISLPSGAVAAGPGAVMREFHSTIDRLKEGNFTLPPFAAARFCLANRDQCEDTGGEEVIILTDDRRQELFTVNSGINRGIKPVNDQPGSDLWSVDVGSGDCEDYALTKRKHLLGLGWSSRALRIAVARTPSGEGHAVLVVKTSTGDLVLDNRNSAVKDWRKTDLSWVSMQSGQNPKVWVSVSAVRPRPLYVSERRQDDLTE